MGILFAKKSYIIAAVTAISACILMIAFSDIAVMSAKQGITLWTSSVLPAMLPFFICVNFMTGIGLVSLLPARVFPFALSAFSGYPMGAKVVGDMCRNGIACADEAKRLISYCSTSGPAFMIGAVGVGMLGSQSAGYVIALSHYAGALLNGIVYTWIYRSSENNIQIEERHIEDCDLMEILTASIFSSFKSMIVILTYIIFFKFIIEVLSGSCMMNDHDSEVAGSLMKGFVEMTVGCSSLTGSGLNIKVCCVLASIIISWGGLSILGQSMSMLSGTDIGFGYLVVTKLTHSIFAGIIALFLGNVML